MKPTSLSVAVTAAWPSAPAFAEEGLLLGRRWRRGRVPPYHDFALLHYQFIGEYFQSKSVYDMLSDAIAVTHP